MFRTLTLGLAFSLTCSPAFADAPLTPKQLPAQAFFSDAKFADVQISPDGKYLALTAPGDSSKTDNGSFVILDAADLTKGIAKFAYPDRKSVWAYWWGIDDTLLVATKTLFLTSDSPEPDGELYHLKIGKKWPDMLLGQLDYYAFSRLVTLIPDDPNHIIVVAWPIGGGTGQLSHPFRINLDTGSVEVGIDTPIRHPGAVMADNEGAVRAAWAHNPATGVSQYFFKPDKDKPSWIEIKLPATGSKIFDTASVPLGFMPGDQDLYWQGRTPSGTLGLFSLDPVTSELKSLFADPDYDLDQVVWSFDYAKDRHIVAAQTMPGLPAVQILDPDDVKAKYLAQFYGLFPDHQVVITSNTRDQSKMVVFVYSDKDPGQFYLFDATTNKMRFLFAANSDIDPQTMAGMQPIEFKARDGQSLHGYLTTPVGVPAKGLPMILVVHGGPHGVSDAWGWDPEAQYFANHGYAVLQVNYRGSGGYGLSFQAAGYRHWDGVMQDDLADAVRWAEQQGIVDPQRVCIYGVSYGGYAALENPIRYPDLYKCAVGYSGVYDLTLLGQDHGTDEELDRKEAVIAYLGSDMEERKRESPVYNADKLKVPVLLIYGGLDKTAVPEHAKEMLAAMDKAGVKYAPPIYESKEGHGFTNPENKFKVYTTMLAFFDQYIGPDVAKH